VCVFLVLVRLVSRVLLREFSCSSLSAQCVREYLRNKIYESDVQDITCPAVNCESHLSEDHIHAAIDESLWKKYLHFKLQSDLRRNPNARWCPRAGCGFGYAFVCGLCSCSLFDLSLDRSLDRQPLVLSALISFLRTHILS
jgi:hypothetical protein